MLVGQAMYGRVEEVLSHELPPPVCHQGVMEGYVTRTPPAQVVNPLGGGDTVTLGAAVKWAYWSSASECSLLDTGQWTVIPADH